MNPPLVCLTRGRRMLVLGIWLVAATALACKVPVFRYALERWQVDRYRMVAVVDGQSSDAVTEALERLNAIAESGANIETEVIDLSALSEEQLWQLEDVDVSADTPLLQVFYPAKEGRRIKCWEGELTADAIARWIDSPLRKQIADDIIAGDSAVFLLVDGADQVQNQNIAEGVQSWLVAAADAIEIPDGVIARGEASQYLQDHPEASMDDVLRSEVPLKVQFRLRRLARDDARESALLSIVDGLVDDPDEPILIPIFGRGRMLDAMNAAECDDKLILNVCRYMVGECSCTVKTLNPGVDLILAVHWSERLGQSVLMVNPKPAGTPTLVAIPGGGDSAEIGADTPFAGPWIRLAGVAFLVSMMFLFGKTVRGSS